MNVVRYGKMGYLLLTVLGVIFIVWAIIVWNMSNFNIGYPVMILAGVMLALYGIFAEPINHFLPSWLKILVSGIILFFLVLMLFLFLYGQWDTADGTEDAVIVLGAGVHGERVSLSLKSRLDATLNYLEKNEKAVIVVSGGQGPGEDIPEAEAMKRYLMARGVPEDQILKEDKSTSTAENFRFSRAILDQRQKGDYSVVYITNDFHSFRAGRIAASVGLNARRQSGSIPYYLIPMTYMRESLACCAWFVKTILPM